MSEEIKNEFLEREHMRALAAHILDQIPHGDINENVQQVGSFITNMLAGLLFGGASLEAALQKIACVGAPYDKCHCVNSDECSYGIARAALKKGK